MCVCTYVRVHVCVHVCATSNVKVVNQIIFSAKLAYDKRRRWCSSELTSREEEGTGREQG